VSTTKQQEIPQSFTELQAATGLTPAELFQMATEWGFMKKQAMLDEARAAKEQAEREAAEEEARRTSIASQPLVTIEWEKTPDEHSCNIGGRKYRGQGPLVNKAFTPPRKVKPGSRAQVPACDAVVLEEGGMATVVEGREHCVWTPTPFMPGVVDNIPRTQREWEEKAA
jgi:hypothetical protein